MNKHQPAPKKPRVQFSSPEEFGNEIYHQARLSLHDQLHGAWQPGEGSARHLNEQLTPVADFEPYSPRERAIMNRQYSPAEHLNSPTQPNTHNLGAVAAAHTIPDVPYRR